VGKEENKRESHAIRKAKIGGKEVLEKKNKELAARVKRT